MALRLRRDVQKASYYVWFLGAEEAKGLRGARVINSVLPYLIDRARTQEPLKVTLQVSHKGIKILQGSSKHFIPHSAITSSVQTNDIVACVLLLYNPATKCPLHVHAYRCDSESTAEALHQQLQVLINRAENQKRFEELESRLGIMPPMAAKSSSSYAGSDLGHKAAYHGSSHAAPLPQRERHETSPKRFSSSLGSDTGNSTRESECSEEHVQGSPLSRSPPIVKAHPGVPIVQSNELFDSLAAELRAKLNGNGPPLLLPPRDYDTVHRSKGNLTAIELRRCRNTLIVGNTTPSPTGGVVAANGGGGGGGVGVVNTSAPVKQVSSRGSSGIGSDLAPSPERQDLNSSSDDEHWSNEADNSVIALKPSQIAMERTIIAHHPQLNRKSAIAPPEDSYLRDLPAKPYVPRHGPTNANGKADPRAKAPTSAAWSREDEIKPIIMRPADYDAKFNRILQAEQKPDYPRAQLRAPDTKETHSKLRDTDKYNEINRLLSKKLSLERGSPEQIDEDFEDSDRASDQGPLAHRTALHYSKENLTDKQKFMEYSSSKKPVSKSYAAEEVQRYGGRHRYVDPADLPFEQPPPAGAPHKYRGSSQHSGDRSEVGAHRAGERERQRERPRELDERDARDGHSRERDRDRKTYSQSNERNPYREPESIPYIKSMEKMMKSSALRYKSYEAEPAGPLANDDAHPKVSQRSKSYAKHADDLERPEREREYIRSRADGPTKDRYKEAKNKFHAIERTGSRYELADTMDAHDYDTPPPSRARARGSVERAEQTGRVYEDWSDEETRPPLPPHTTHGPPAAALKARARSRSRDNVWESSGPSTRGHDMLPPRERDYGYDMRGREPTNKRAEPRYEPRYDARQNTPSSGHRDAYATRHRDHSEEYRRERGHTGHGRRDYSPDRGSEYTVRSNETTPVQHGGNTAAVRVASKHGGDSAAPPNSKGVANMSKAGYRHSYAEPVFARSGGRVGLAAVNPY